MSLPAVRPRAALPRLRPAAAARRAGAWARTPYALILLGYVLLPEFEIEPGEETWLYENCNRAFHAAVEKAVPLVPEKQGTEGDRRYVLAEAPDGSPYTKPRTYLSGAGGLVSTAADYMR